MSYTWRLGYHDNLVDVDWLVPAYGYPMRVTTAPHRRGVVHGDLHEVMVFRQCGRSERLAFLTVLAVDVFRSEILGRECLRRKRYPLVGLRIA